jgi:hypothetical protein
MAPSGISPSQPAQQVAPLSSPRRQTRGQAASISDVDALSSNQASNNRPAAGKAGHRVDISA